MEQFKKRVEKLLSDSIFLWRLLKLLFKVLQFSKPGIGNLSKSWCLKDVFSEQSKVSVASIIFQRAESSVSFCRISSSSSLKTFVMNLVSECTDSSHPSQ